ncbi:hypothetical protein KR074_000622 [Drosophila pseudoananassae]|nr:hypothetical protein KR074_000622 [Drosophila pseudoananassae]
MYYGGSYSCGDGPTLEMPTQIDNINEEDIDYDMLNEVRASIRKLLINETSMVLLMEKRLQKPQKLVVEFQERSKKVRGDIQYIQLKTQELQKSLEKVEAARKKRDALLAKKQKRTKKFSETKGINVEKTLTRWSLLIKKSRATRLPSWPTYRSISQGPEGPWRHSTDEWVE